MERSKISIGIIVGVVIAIGSAWYVISSSNGKLENKGATDELDAVRKVVTDFGEVLKNVSLLSPTASKQIQKQYAPYVSDSLLVNWSENIKDAPGRLTSSPWPERIEIQRLEKKGAEKFNVSGQIILVTSMEKASETDGNAGTQPIQLVIQKKSRVWKITALWKGPGL